LAEEALPVSLRLNRPGQAPPPSLVAPAVAFARRTALIAALALASAGPGLAQTQPAAPPPAVVVAPVAMEDVTPTFQYVGRIQAIQTLNLVARVEGFLDAVEFQEGAHIKAGQRLYEIEKAPFQAALDQANAQVAAGQAQLAGAQAQLTNAQLNLDRQKALVKGGTVSQAVVDQAQADHDKAAADVEAANAAIQQAQAQVETAKLNLSYTDISSTIDGRIGKTNVTQGNLVNMAAGTLATVVQIDPMRVVFSIAESQYVEVAKTVQPESAQPGSGAFVPTLLLADGSAYADPGKIAFISNEIDPSTGTLPVYADFPNAKELLLPGGFVTVTVKRGKEVQAPVIPASAVLEDKDGQYVFTVDSTNKAIQTRIKTSEQVGTNLVVTSGLKAGDIVITEGIQRVRTGITVSPQPAAAAGAADPAAKPASGSSGN
jgi:membrane fusion protein (multidrug efflux system)